MQATQIKITKYSDLVTEVSALFPFFGPERRVMLFNCAYEDLAAALESYRSSRGSLVQNVFPFLSLDEREFLISGFYPEEWPHNEPLYQLCNRELV